MTGDLHHIKNLNPADLESWLHSNSQPAYRGRQIFSWLYEHQVSSFDEMNNLPKTLRDKLNAVFYVDALHLLKEQSSPDGTVKFLYCLPDNQNIETVLIPSARRQTVCISTQVGCPVGCTFCASGSDGFTRNLQAGEIIDQLCMSRRRLGRNPDNVVVMGMGEPLLNYDNLVQALTAINSPWGLGLGVRHVTVSTSGIIPGLKKLVAGAYKWNLALSLHAPDDKIRAKLIPNQTRYPLEDILTWCEKYSKSSNRMLTLEYVLIAGVNDLPEHSREVGKIARRLHAKVNLIPYNSVGGDFKRPGRHRCQKFADILTSNGVTVILREERGSEISAACGQLRLTFNSKG